MDAVFPPAPWVAGVTGTSPRSSPTSRPARPFGRLARIPGVRLRLEVEQNTALVVLAQEAHRILEDIRRIPSGYLGLELPRERFLVGEFRPLPEDRDPLFDGDGARFTAHDA
ncbi:hypothetical protein AB0L56_08760 [Streptomyces sp. NPDC052079]|uniref:hypothetical protein n=1 Tax=unclassified Streptomyces TaxID=2593676 RepID=UPI0033D2EBC2